MISDYETRLEKVIEILLVNPELTAKEYLAVMQEQGITKGQSITNFRKLIVVLRRSGWPIHGYANDNGKYVYRIACTREEKDLWFKDNVRGPWWGNGTMNSDK